jgi:hypothetical protein
METERGTTQEFNRFPFVRDLHEIQPVFPEADFGLGITSGLLVTRARPVRAIADGSCPGYAEVIPVDPVSRRIFWTLN